MFNRALWAGIVAGALTTIPLPAGTPEERLRMEKLLTEYQPALKLFLAGSLREEDDSEASFTPSPQLKDGALKLCSIATVQMEALLQEGKTAEALELLGAIFRATSQSSMKSPIILNARYRQLGETRAIKALARQFSKLDSDDIQRLSRLLAEAPVWPSAAELIRTEQRLCAEWIDSAIAKAEASSDPREAMQKAAEAFISPVPLSALFNGRQAPLKTSREMLETLNADFTRLAEIAEKPNVDQFQEATALITEIRERKSAVAFLSRNYTFRPYETFAQVQNANLYRAALRAAIELKRQGGGIPAEVKDPITGELFLCRKTEDGFDLEAKGPIYKVAGVEKQVVVSFR